MKEKLDLLCVECGKVMKDNGTYFPVCDCLLDKMVKEISDCVDKEIVEGTLDYFKERCSIGLGVPKEYLDSTRKKD